MRSSMWRTRNSGTSHRFSSERDTDSPSATRPNCPPTRPRWSKLARKRP